MTATHDNLSLQMAAQREGRTVPTVLLVEDNPDTLLLLRHILSRMNVVVATKGAEVFDAYLTHAPDVVFLDINLPDGSGHDVLKQLIQADTKAFIVMLSGNSYKIDIAKAIKGGAKGFIAKPCSKATLIEWVAKAFGPVDPNAKKA